MSQCVDTLFYIATAVQDWSLVIVVSSSIKFICWESLARQSQQASSRMVPCLSNTTLVTKEHASTHTFNPSLVMLQLPRAGSSQHTFFNTSVITCLKGTSLSGSSHPLVIVFTCLFIISCGATHKWGKCPTSFPQIENVVHCVISTGSSGITVSFPAQSVVLPSRPWRPTF